MCCYFEINQTLKKPWIHFHFIRFLSHCVFRHIIRSCNIGTKCEFRIIIKAAFVSGLLNQQTCLCSTPALQLKSVTFSRTLACKLNAADIPVISVWDISCWWDISGTIQRNISPQLKQSSDQCWNLSWVDIRENSDSENLLPNVPRY